MAGIGNDMLQSTTKKKAANCVHSIVNKFTNQYSIIIYFEYMFIPE